MTETDFDNLILSKAKLVNRAVKGYLARHPSLAHLSHDFKQAGQLGLLQGVRQRIETQQPITDGYLTSCIQRSISDAAINDGNSLKIPKSTQRLARKNGAKIDRKFVTNLPTNFDIADERGPSLLQQVIECCATELEQTIVKMLDAEFNQKEIAASLGIDARRISEMIQKIKRRFDNDEDGTDEPYVKVAKGDGTKCRCGQPFARWANATRCEECEAEDYQKFNGLSQRANIAA